MKRFLSMMAVLVVVALIGLALIGAIYGKDSKDGKADGTELPHMLGKMYTVEHDGHLLILWTSYYKGGIVHHPDCPCGKSEGRVEVVFGKGN